MFRTGVYVWRTSLNPNVLRKLIPGRFRKFYLSNLLMIFMVVFLLKSRFPRFDPSTKVVMEARKFLFPKITERWLAQHLQQHGRLSAQRFLTKKAHSPIQYPRRRKRGPSPFCGALCSWNFVSLEKKRSGTFSRIVQRFFMANFAKNVSHGADHYLLSA